MSANGSVKPPQHGSPKEEKSRLLPFVSLRTLANIFGPFADLSSYMQNRRLRHLSGISIRNLAFNTSPPRARGKTFDDEAVPHTLKTSAKLLAVSEGNSLSHSRSFSDLSAQGNSNISPETSIRPLDTHRLSFGSGHSRPKPTLQRVNTSPKQRQDTLKDAVSRRTADVFFSVHCNVAKGTSS